MGKQFAQLLQHYIESSGVKRTHIASVAGISYNYLARLVGGTRWPSDQVVCRLAQALHLSREQTAELLAAAGFTPPATLLIDSKAQQVSQTLAASVEATSQKDRLIQQIYRLTQEIPEKLSSPFFEEIQCFLGYARYKYILSGGISPLELDRKRSRKILPEMLFAQHDDQAQLAIIAQIIGELHTGPDETMGRTQDLTEDTLSAIDHLIGNLLSGEMSTTNYQPQLAIQTLHMLHEGTPWEIRRRIAEALPSLCCLDIAGSEQLMAALRTDFDERHGADIRRRIIEALPALFDTRVESLPTILRLLYPRSDDDIYVALAIVETCGDIQVKAKYFLEQRDGSIAPDLEKSIQRFLSESARIQRQMLVERDSIEQESLQFSIALHNLLPAPDTLLISLQEGLQSEKKLIQLVAVRYLERVLPLRPVEVLKLYQELLPKMPEKNVRRPVAKALPRLLQSLKETSLAIRALTRSVILDLANDPDVQIRRAVADHAMQIFSIDREFLLALLRCMHDDADQAIRHRLRPVSLRLAQVWLTWYAETAGLVDTNRHGQTQVLKQPFEE